MQQFTVPQFIDVEDKIIGPITVRQFLIMLACFMVIALFYRIFDFSAFVVSGIFTLLAFGVLAFLKINGMPFHYFVLNFIQTLKKPSLRVWNNSMNVEIYAFEKEEKTVSEVPIVQPKFYTTSRLAELSLIVDTQGVYRGDGRGREIKLKSNVNSFS